MSDYISKQSVIDIVNKEIERVTNSYEHNTQLRILFAIKELPILDKKEIIRKTVERIVERLEECEERYDDVALSEMNENGHTLDFEYAKGKKYGVEEAIKIAKEECGISE